MMQNFDLSLFNKFYIESGWNALFSSCIRTLGNLEIILLWLFLIGYWFYGRFRKSDEYKKDALRIAYAILWALWTLQILLFMLPFRARPFVKVHIVPIIEHLPDSSFPSEHAVFVWASLIALYYSQIPKIFKYILIISGITMSVARIIWGIHYPSDILFWWIIGFIIWELIYRNVFLTRNKLWNFLLEFPIIIGKKIWL